MEVFEIKKILKERKITYPELAKMTGLSLSCITKIFGGYAQYPRVDTMQAIERALGIGNQQQMTPEYVLTDDEKMLVEAYRKVLPSLKGYAKETVMRLAGMKMDEQSERKNG